MRGRVSAGLEAELRLDLRGPSGSQSTVTAVMDTGSSEHLTLAPGTIAALQLPIRQTAQFALADGTTVSLDMYRAEVLWDGRWRSILVTAAAGGSLFGMALLRRHRVVMDVVDGGDLTITALP